MKVYAYENPTILQFQTLFVPCDEAHSSTLVLPEEQQNAVTQKTNSLNKPGDLLFLSPLTPSNISEREVCIL